MTIEDRLVEFLLHFRAQKYSIKLYQSHILKVLPLASKLFDHLQKNSIFQVDTYASIQHENLSHRQLECLRSTKCLELRRVSGLKSYIYTSKGLRTLGWTNFLLSCSSK